MKYHFGDFVVSPSRRLLLRGGRELPLIPRYFDLLVLLIERRHEAVHRRDIFDAVWTDVIVSDSALSQAIRTIRRALDDDPREPRFIRTISRHGYRFVFDNVVEAADDNGAATPETATAVPAALEDYEPLLARLTADGNGAGEEDRRDAAERLHALGTAETLARLGTRPGHVRARALLRDTRWDSPAAADVPVFGAPEAFAVARAIVALRLRRAARLVASRWAGASAGGGLAGVIAGGLGGLVLAVLPDSHSPAGVAPVLAVIGGACGAVAGAGVGAGLAVAETTARSRRTLALILFAAAGGGIIGASAQLLVRWSLAALVGMHVEVGGAIEGLVIGAAAGLGYALATRRVEGGMATPRGRRRMQAALVTAALCGLGALALTAQGHPLVGGTVHAVASAAKGSQVSLAPLGRLLGEPDFGPISQAIIGFGEAALFGFGLTLGLTRRPIMTAAFRDGIINVQTLHTTTAIVLNEHEPLLMSDFRTLLARAAPRALFYRHDDMDARTVNLSPGERANGHSHCRAILLGATASLNVVDGRLQRGCWQRLFFVELDGPRPREVSVLLLGSGR